MRPWNKFPFLFAPDWIWLMDRNYHGAARIARMIRSTHELIRLKSDIPLKRISQILPDGSYRAELSGDGVTVCVYRMRAEATPLSGSGAGQDLFAGGL
jgi:hypothetical protein